jgi:hypothetical protein
MIVPSLDCDEDEDIVLLRPSVRQFAEKESAPAL